MGNDLATIIGIFGLVAVMLLSFQYRIITERTILPLVLSSIVVVISFFLSLAGMNMLSKSTFWDYFGIEYINDIFYKIVLSVPFLLPYLYFTFSKKHKVESILKRILLTLVAAFMAVFWGATYIGIHISIYGQ